MNASPSKIRSHRILGCAAVLHAAVVAASLIGLVFLDSPSGSFKSSELLREIAGWIWLVLATLWFLWPFVLIFHSGRSILRVLLPLLIAYPFYLAWSDVCSRMIDSEKCGLPQGMELSPHGILGYSLWYGIGWVDAQKDAKTGRLILEAYGLGPFAPGAPNFSAATQEKYHIEINHVAGCVVSTLTMAHAKGYNVAMVTEIKRRCGIAMVKEAEDEDARWIQSYDDGKEAGRTEALGELQAGRLAIEVSDPSKQGDAEFEKMLRAQYQISLRRVDPKADPKMANKVFGHRTGYNEVAEAEITRRFGKGTVESIWKSFYHNRALSASETPVND